MVETYSRFQLYTDINNFLVISVLVLSRVARDFKVVMTLTHSTPAAYSYFQAFKNILTQVHSHFYAVPAVKEIITRQFCTSIILMREATCRNVN